MKKLILSSILQKFIVFFLTAIIGLLSGFAATLIFRGPLIVGISATVMIVISLTLLMTIVSLIGDGVLMRTGKWKRWMKLLFVILPNLLLVYYYFLDKGIFLELPKFKVLSQVVWYGSIVLSFLYWGIDECIVPFIKSKFKNKAIELQAKI